MKTYHADFFDKGGLNVRLEADDWRSLKQWIIDELAETNIEESGVTLVIYVKEPRRG